MRTMISIGVAKAQANVSRLPILRSQLMISNLAADSDCGWSHASREGIRAKKLINYLDIMSITAKEKAFVSPSIRVAPSLTEPIVKNESKAPFVRLKRSVVGTASMTSRNTAPMSLDCPADLASYCPLSAVSKPQCLLWSLGNRRRADRPMFSVVPHRLP